MILQQKYLCANKTCWYTNLSRGITNLVVTHMGYNLYISFMFLYFAFDFHMGYNLYISFMFLYFAFDFHMGYNLYISFMFLYFAFDF